MQEISLCEALSELAEAIRKDACACSRFNWIWECLMQENDWQGFVSRANQVVAREISLYSPGSLLSGGMDSVSDMLAPMRSLASFWRWSGEEGTCLWLEYTGRLLEGFEGCDGWQKLLGEAEDNTIREKLQAMDGKERGEQAVAYARLFCRIALAMHLASARIGKIYSLLHDCRNSERKP